MIKFLLGQLGQDKICRVVCFEGGTATLKELKPSQEKRRFLYL